MFSTEFGHNTSQIWLINCAISIIVNLVCTDVLVAYIGVLIVIYVPLLKQKCKKRYQVHQSISGLAEDVVDVMNARKEAQGLDSESKNLGITDMLKN